MSSNNIKFFLEAYDMIHLLPTFTKNKIDDLTVLQRLTKEELKELIPCLGDRKKIEIALSEISSTETVLSDEKSSQSSILPSEKVTPSNKIEILHITQTEEPVTKKPKVSSILSSDLDVASTSSLSSDFDAASTSSVVLFNETLEVSNINNNINSMINDVLNTYEVINFDLRGLLNNHIIGRAILLKFEKTEIIDNKDRNHLCDIIICHFLNEKKRLNNAVISILADKIVEIFQGERKSTYYVSPIGKKRSRYNKPEVARGKLIDKHRNKLSILRKTLAASEVSTIKEDQDVSKEVLDSKIWLQHNSEPLQDVMYHWKLSSPIRKIGQLSLSECFEEWPILRTQAAISLIESDFEQRFNLKKFFDLSKNIAN